MLNTSIKVDVVIATGNRNGDSVAQMARFRTNSLAKPSSSPALTIPVTDCPWLSTAAVHISVHNSIHGL